MIIQNTLSHSLEANGVLVGIGSTTITKSNYDKFIKHPLMAELLENGSLLVDEQKQLTVSELEKRIADSFDLKALEQIAKEDERKGVQTAVKKRIEELKEGK